MAYEYKGSTAIISGLIQENNADFPIARAADIVMGDGTRLQEYLDNGGNDNDADWQPKSDDTLETASKTVVGGINELNSKSLDKVDVLETWKGLDSVYDISEEGTGGIAWSDGATFYDADRNAIARSQIYHRVPIMPGDNVSFTVDRDNKVIKINATGGSGEAGLPPYSESDNDKFLKLVDGTPTWVTIEDGDGVEY